MEKECKDCGKLLDLSFFYKNKGAKDGHLNRCKKCFNFIVDTIKTIKYHSDNVYREKVRNANRLYVRSQKFKDYGRNKYLNDEKFRIRKKAREMVRYYIRKGTLVKSPCEICGDKNPQAHHDNYVQKTKVRWLCRKHHTEWHRANEPKYV